MWCRRCAQDVPGVPSLEEGRFTCARCAEPLIGIAAARSEREQGAAQAGREELRREEHAARRPPSYDGWEIEQQLRHAFRVLGASRIAAKERASDASDAPNFRVDAGHGVPAPRGRKRSRRTAPLPTRRAKRSVAAEKQRKRAVRGDRLLAAMAWSALSLGTMGFVCGLALLGWSKNWGISELWNIGSPIVLAGQIALVLGLGLQLDRIWRASRHAAARLETVDQQLDDLKTSTNLLGTAHGPSAAFYAHWAGGAGPEILLGDLKSQLDLLAVKLAEK